MLMDVYYRDSTSPNYAQNQQKVLPYMVHFNTETEMTAFMQKLQRERFDNVGSSASSYRHVLVNLVFKRFSVIEKACKHSCVGDRTYEEEEFLTEVYEPWQRHEDIDLSPAIIEMDGDEYVMGLMNMTLIQQLDEEHEKLMEAIRAANEAGQPMPPRSSVTCLPAEFRIGAKTIIRMRYTASTVILTTSWFTGEGGVADEILLEHRTEWPEEKVFEHDGAKDLIPVMPVLIPLDKDGHPSRQLFRNEPNGALTKGGSLYYIQGGRTNIWDGDGPIQVKNFSKAKAWIGNTDDTYAIDWMFWEGLLIPLNPILSLRARDIWNSGLARVDIDRLPGAFSEEAPIPEPEFEESGEDY